MLSNTLSRLILVMYAPPRPLFLPRLSETSPSLGLENGRDALLHVAERDLSLLELDYAVVGMR